MSGSIFGYPTIEAELTGLINIANADYGSSFGPTDLSFTATDYDSFEQRQRFDVRDTTGKYFGIRDNVGIFKRNFQTLFLGITVHVQAGSGLTNRVIIDALSATYGLTKFADSDFAPGLLDLNTPVDDDEVFVSWPIATTSLTWVGKVEFYLRNTKTSLKTLITDDHLEAFDPNVQTGFLNDVRVTALPGIPYPEYYNLEDIIIVTELNGLEYPGNQDLSTIITKTELDGLDYPTSLSLDSLTATLTGLEYYPTFALNSIVKGDTDGLEYPSGVTSNRFSALVLTRPLDFSDYQNAIQRFRVGDNITDANLVTVIVGKIADAFSSMNTESRKTSLTVAFTNATVQSISRKRSQYGWTETVTVKPSTASFIAGNAVLRYDIETDE